MHWTFYVFFIAWSIGWLMVGVKTKQPLFVYLHAGILCAWAWLIAYRLIG